MTLTAWSQALRLVSSIKIYYTAKVSIVLPTILADRPNRVFNLENEFRQCQIFLLDFRSVLFQFNLPQFNRCRLYSWWTSFILHFEFNSALLINVHRFPVSYFIADYGREDLKLQLNRRFKTALSSSDSLPSPMVGLSALSSQLRVSSSQGPFQSTCAHFIIGQASSS